MSETGEIKVEAKKVVRYSHSKLKNQASCPAKNHFARLAHDGIIETDPAYPLVFGVAAHKGIEDDLKHGLDPVTQAYEYIQEELLDKYPAKKLNQTTIQKKWDLVKKCLDNYINNFRKDLILDMELMEVEPESVLEVKLEVPFREGILTGVIDVLLPNGRYMDWKTGARVPSDDTLIRDPQAGIYYYLAKQLKMRVPSVFEYVYLTGKNVQMKRDGKGNPTPDRENPRNLYSFKVYQDDNKVDRLFAEYVNPLAEQYERGVLYKNPSDMNCTSCQYRTACWQTELPNVQEARDALVIDIIGLVKEEE